MSTNPVLLHSGIFIKLVILASDTFSHEKISSKMLLSVKTELGTLNWGPCHFSLMLILSELTWHLLFKGSLSCLFHAPLDYLT